MNELLIIAVFAVTLAVMVLWPQPADAHCDTMEGPTAKDGVKALESADLDHALKWVTPDGGTELREVFERSLAARKLGPEAQEVADRWFLENLVRIHRAGEGAAFTGLQPAGAPVEEKVAAADRSIEQGDLRPLAGLVPAERRPELERRFAKVLERRGYDVHDVDAGRSYIEAYVSFFKFAEGHDHDHVDAHAGHGH
ncbi:DUF6448 family protein [Streptomyces sp. GD-15H]|uniref:DUF6448 family protein n=1 Tax=Streptomyces sp. GD-15H TaxID=3129112 RepID=UPI00324CEAA0